jgi:Ubiquitin-like autophagy protein Apg12
VRATFLEAARLRCFRVLLNGLLQVAQFGTGNDLSSHFSLSLAFRFRHVDRSAEDQRFGAVMAFVTKMIKQPAFLYCNSCFCPSPDELLRDIRDCFAQRRDGHIANDELIVHYSLQEAWG